MALVLSLAFTFQFQFQFQIHLLFSPQQTNLGIGVLRE